LLLSVKPAPVVNVLVTQFFLSVFFTVFAFIVKQQIKIYPVKILRRISPVRISTCRKRAGEIL
jgi:hypothetical protein